jgi:hypothetical protein
MDEQGFLEIRIGGRLRADSSRGVPPPRPHGDHAREVDSGVADGLGGSPQVRFGIRRKAVKLEVCLPPSDFPLRLVPGFECECVLRTCALPVSWSVVAKK